MGETTAVEVALDEVFHCSILCHFSMTVRIAPTPVANATIDAPIVESFILLARSPSSIRVR
jgi:hypothetical protein